MRIRKPVNEIKKIAETTGMVIRLHNGITAYFECAYDGMKAIKEHSFKDASYIEKDRKEYSGKEETND